MGKAAKSKQTKPLPPNPLITRGRKRALETGRTDPMAAAVNPHRKNTKVWKEWEATNNPEPPRAPATEPETPMGPQLQSTTTDSLVTTLNDLVTRVHALDDFTTDKLDGLDTLLDQKIELLATVLSKLQPLLTATPTQTVQSVNTGLQQHLVMPTTNLNGTAPENLTGLWNWVDKTTLKTITDLEFDITNLHKLTPPEDTTLFNLNLDATTYGGLHVATDGTVTSITASHKLDKAIPSWAHWISAFSVYESIRAAYDPTGSFGRVFPMFNREMNHLQLCYPWPNVLRYFLETFRFLQDKPAEKWLDPHIKAYTKYLHHNTIPTVPTTTPKPVSRKLPADKYSHSLTKQKYTPEERAQQICQAYNLQDKGCKATCPFGRRHVCLIADCGKNHPQFQHK